jgi:hypothetical protein
VEVVALVLSVLSLVVAGIGTVLSNARAKASEGIAREALADSRRAVEQGLWSDVIEAVQRIIGMDPTTEPIGTRFQDLRVASTSLVDGLPEWHGLGASGWPSNTSSGPRWRVR